MCVQHQQVKLERSAFRFLPSAPGPNLNGSGSADFRVRCWRCSVPGSSLRRLPSTSSACDLFTQQVRRVRLDLAIQRGCRRRARPCSREPMRSSRRFVRNWTFRGSEVAAKWERFRPRRRTSGRAWTSFRPLYQGGGPKLPLLIRTGRER